MAQREAIRNRNRVYQVSTVRDKGSSACSRAFETEMHDDSTSKGDAYYKFYSDFPYTCQVFQFRANAVPALATTKPAIAKRFLTS
jgi:hypothetical protein